MSSDKNKLKNLLSKLLDKRLKRLEKRNIEEENDLKYTKIECQKHNKLLNQLSLNLINKKNNTGKISVNESLYNKSELIKRKDSQNSNKFIFSPKNKNNNYRNALTPTKNNFIYSKTTENWTKKRNKKYNYVKSRYMDETINISNINSRKNKCIKKICLTPEPRLKKKKNINTKINKINYEPKKINFGNINIKNNNKIRNINSIKREINKKKNTIISKIDLDHDEINFVLEELRKEKEEYNSEEEEEEENNNNNSDNKNSDSENSTSNSNNSFSQKNQKVSYIIKNKNILSIFIKFITSSEGENIVILISSFLDQKTKFNFFSCSKALIQYLKNDLNNIFNNILKNNQINSLLNLDNKLKDLKKQFCNEDFESIKYSFQLSKNSIKSLEILDDINYNDIFKKENLEPPLNNIILIYRIFFQLIDKEELTKIQNNKKFWNKARNYILENNYNKTGSYIKEYSTEFDFTKENVYKVKKLIAGKEDKLKPINYENICKTTGLFVFIIKDYLEYSGLIPNDKKIMPKVFINYLEYVKEILKHCKDYIDFLK